jgi:hypothetical protein
MVIYSKHFEALEAVIATALNIVKNRPLADLYVLRAGNATSSQSKRNDSCILGRTHYGPDRKLL